KRTGEKRSCASAIGEIENSAGAKVQSAASSSFDAWIIQYRPNENSANNSISYYSKGSVIGTIMDLEIAHATKGVKSLDDVMKAMYLQCKKTGRGYTDGEFKAMVEKISGVSFTDFWAKYVTGTAPIDYNKYFSYAGVTVKNENEGKSVPYLGVAVRKTEGRYIVSSVARNSGGWIDGVNVNDEVTAIDGVAIESAIGQGNSISLTNKNVNDVIKISVRRDGLVRDINVTLVPRSTMRLTATINADATAAQKAVLNRWLGI
ncbi:MAG: PDZ domain-containing protein, partial [Sphingobacteriales bacterium]